MVLHLTGEKKKQGQALDHINQVLEKDPENQKALIAKMHVADGLGEYEQLSQVTKKIIEKSKEKEGGRTQTSLVWKLRGKGLDLSGEEEKALRVYDEASELFPRDAEIPFRKGLIYMGRENKEEAAKWFQKALELDPGSRRPGNYYKK